MTVDIERGASGKKNWEKFDVRARKMVNYACEGQSQAKL